MLGILYLILCAAFGIAFVGLTVPDVRRLYVACSPSAKAITHIPNTLFTVPAGLITGMMCVPFFNYYVTLGLSYIIESGELCKRLGVLITFAFFLWMILTCLILINRKRVKREEQKASGATSIEDYNFSIFDSVFYGAVIFIVTVAATFLMFYTYRINGNNLLNGYSTFSDLSPHTAMVSSFGKGFNFPTQYMHFSGDGIKYHFLFYFFSGTLEYLGLPIDYALNLPSIISMVCALILLGLLAVLISSRRASFLIAPVLVFLRSSLNVFFHFKELVGLGNTPAQAIKAILGNSSWYAVTDYDDWGIWAINVYPNQRHLMLGVAVMLIVIILFVPFIRRLGISISRAGGFGGGVKAFAFSKNAWLTRSNDPLYPISATLLACVLVIVMPYFHGSCLIALLLVLFGMAIVSESRLLYLIVAICAIASSYIQTLVFSGGYKNVVSLEFHPGFILDKMSFTTLGRYLLIVTGGTLIIATIYALIVLIVDLVNKKPIHRFLLFLCCFNPLIFAFLFQVSLEMLANHKFIQVSLILLDAFVAALIGNLLYIPIKRRKASSDADEEASDSLAAVADTADGMLAVAVAAADDKGVRAPEIAATSAFGEPVTDEEETPSAKETPDLAAIEAHTGIDADIAGLTGTSDLIPAETEKEEKPEEEIKEEALPAELIFGDDNKESESVEDDEDDEAKAGVAALAALFGDDEEDKEEAAKTEPEAGEETSSEVEEADAADAMEASAEENTESSEKTVSEEPAPAEEKTEETSEETSGENAEEAESDETDDSDDAIMASAPEPAHVAMRPGSMVLNNFTFGEDEPDDEADANASESSNEFLTVASDSGSESGETDNNAAVYKHEPIKPKKQKGLPLPAWIALELAGILLAIALMLPLTATGVSEWATYINLNKTPLSVDTNSPVTKWILDNTEPDDVFLTPEWSMNRFILAGRPMYYGWPYYAWSAGHDTYTRDTIYIWLISGCGGDIDEFTRYCKERHIKYLIADPELEQTDFGNGISFNKEFFEENLTQAAYFAEENTTIYRIY
ncbi:MAG: hypothetical protein IKH82_03305 [Clostridiales bacterium]|nr:hypothetical protein [Clostridiales bacterium]